MADFDPYYTWLGISPQDQPPNHYRLLGIDLFEPNAEVITRAADRQLAYVRTLQATKHSELAVKIRDEISEARVCLLDPAKKAKYDEELRAETRDLKESTEAPKTSTTLTAKTEEAVEESEAPSQQEEESSLNADLVEKPTVKKESSSRKRRVFVGLAVLTIAFVAVLIVGWITWPKRTPTISLDSSETVGLNNAVLEEEFALDLGDGVKMEFVLIPAGEFMMGSPEDERREAAETYRSRGMPGSHAEWVLETFMAERPQHLVEITEPFYMGKYEVTQEQWQALMDSNPSKVIHLDNPVEHVSWNDCQAFMQKLNERFADKGLKFSLPTEAQWEYACRAGSNTLYFFGDNAAELGEYAWFGHDSIMKVQPLEAKIHPVGQKKPNRWGLYDMHGNVWEWCADRYAENYYARSPREDPIGPSSGADRVARGSTGGDFPEGCRSARRIWHVPSHRSVYGFRVVGKPISQVGP